MRRRAFLGFLAGTGLTGVRVGRAQTSSQRRIGVLVGLHQTNTEAVRRLNAFREALTMKGWIEDKNIRFEYRYVPDPEFLLKAATELVDGGSELIVAWSTPEVIAAQRATKTIPIVFTAAADPLGSGIIQSMAKPGGNVTGATNFEPTMGTKWLGLLREIVPTTDRIAIITNTHNPAERGMRAAIEEAGRAEGVQITVIPAESVPELDSGFQGFAASANGGFIVVPSITTNALRTRIVEHAARFRVPGVYPFRFFAEEGGLISYGADSIHLAQQCALHVDRILRGERPAELPVHGPTKFDLVINLKTAAALGLSIPVSLLAVADEVIE